MARIQVDPSVIHHKAFQSFSTQSKVPAIHPGQIGPLNRDQLHGWQATLQVIVQVLKVTPDVGDHLLQPGLTMVVGGLSSDKAKRVCAPKTQRPQFDPKFFSKLCIGHNDIGGLQASQAEGLTGCRTDKNVF